MPGSGQLGLMMAEGFRLPHPTVTTVIKALRSERVLTIKGRGSSAAQMTVADAAAIVVGIMSGAVTAEIPAIVRHALQMPLVHPTPPNSDASEVSVPARHRFLDGFTALFAGGWDEAAGPVGADDHMYGVRVAVGFDGRRKECFGVIEDRDHDGAQIKYYYGTPQPRASISIDERPDGLGLELYRDPPTFVFSASLDGVGLAALKRALASPPSDPAAELPSGNGMRSGKT